MGSSVQEPEPPKNVRRPSQEPAEPEQKTKLWRRLFKQLDKYIRLFFSFRPVSKEKIKLNVKRFFHIFPIVLAIVGAGIIGKMAERYVRKSPAFSIRTTIIHGELRLSEIEVLRIAGLSIGQNIFEMSPNDVQARLLRHPWIAQADVRRRIPNTFEITIQERKAVALLLLDRVYLVGQDATVFKEATKDDPIELPIVTGIETNTFIDDRNYRSALLLEIVALLHDYRAAGLEQREPIQEIHIEPTGAFEIYINEDATLVRLGTSPFLLKFRKLRRILDELNQRHSRPLYVYLDNARRPDRVTVRLRETSTRE